MLEIRNEFWDLEDSRKLHRDPQAALRLSGALNVEGFSVELMLAELIPADLSGVPADLRSSFEERLGQWVIETPTRPARRGPSGSMSLTPYLISIPLSASRT